MNSSFFIWSVLLLCIYQGIVVSGQEFKPGIEESTTITQSTNNDLVHTVFCAGPNNATWQEQHGRLQSSLDFVNERETRIAFNTSQDCADASYSNALQQRAYQYLLVVHAAQNLLCNQTSENPFDISDSKFVELSQIVRSAEEILNAIKPLVLQILQSPSCQAFLGKNPLASTIQRIVASATVSALAGSSTSVTQSKKPTST